MIENSYSVDGFKGDPIRIKLIGSNKGLQYLGPGSLDNDNITINAKTGKIKAERILRGEHNEKICYSIERVFPKEEIKEIIEEIVEPLRQPHNICTASYTSTYIWNDKNKKYTYSEGDIDSLLKRLHINLDFLKPLYSGSI